MPGCDTFVMTDLPEVGLAAAQVLDYSQQGMRLLFRPAVDMEVGSCIQVADSTLVPADQAAVQWCHHKRHFTVAGIRSMGQVCCTALWMDGVSPG